MSKSEKRSSGHFMDDRTKARNPRRIPTSNKHKWDWYEELEESKLDNAKLR